MGTFINSDTWTGRCVIWKDLRIGAPMDKGERQADLSSKETPQISLEPSPLVQPLHCRPGCQIMRKGRETSDAKLNCGCLDLPLA